MAGSYGHVTDDEGRLRDGEAINAMLDCQSGDVVECVEEMYGMIWFLAHKLQVYADSPMDEWVALAQQEYQRGLMRSPGQVET